MTKKTKKRPVVVRFLDHASYVGGLDEYKLFECEVVGYLAETTPLMYKIVAWVAADDLNDSNNEGYAILKSAVTSMRFLK
jgi:hypothetical protein